MDAVMSGVPAQVLAERRALGLDTFDEVWDGVLHMVPAPFDEHQRLGGRLFALLLPLADAASLEARYEFGLYRPGSVGDRDFRVPDLVVFDASVCRDRGVEGAARLVIEIRSPGDGSFQKLPFYGEVGVAEVLIIDRDTKAIRRWVNDGQGHLTETASDELGRHALTALPLELWTEAGHILARADRTDVRI